MAIVAITGSRPIRPPDDLRTAGGMPPPVPLTPLWGGALLPNGLIDISAVNDGRYLVVVMMMVVRRPIGNRIRILAERIPYNTPGVVVRGVLLQDAADPLQVHRTANGRWPASNMRLLKGHAAPDLPDGRPPPGSAVVVVASAATAHAVGCPRYPIQSLPIRSRQPAPPTGKKYLARTRH